MKQENIFSHPKLLAYNILVFGLMITCYYYPVLRYFVFLPLMVMGLVLFLFRIFGQQEKKRTAINTINHIVHIISGVLYAVAVLYPKYILYVCAMILIIVVVMNIMGKFIKPAEDESDITENQTETE